MRNLVKPSLARSYNALLDVKVAESTLLARGGEETVGTLLSIIRKAGLQEHMGLRLLHKHNEVSDDEIMLEYMVEDDEGFALCTMPAKNAVQGEATCNSWQATETGYVECEYSQSELLTTDSSLLDEGKAVFRELRLALLDFGVSNLVGPSLNYSSLVESYKPTSNSRLLEKTDIENRANVVRYVDLADQSFLSSVKTKWRAEQVRDKNGKLIWANGCACACSVFPEGGHQGTHTHVGGSADKDKDKDKDKEKDHPEKEQGKPKK